MHPTSTSRRALTAVAAVVLLCGCSPKPTAGTGSSSPGPATSAAKSTSSAASAPTSSRLGDDWVEPPKIPDMPTDGSVQVVPAGTQEAPTGGVTTTTQPVAQFLTADGKNSCRMTADRVECSFTQGFVGEESPVTLPDPATYCRSSTMVSGLVLGPRGNAFRCGRRDLAPAFLGTPDTRWAGSTPKTLTVDGSARVVLPTERGLQLGKYLCVPRGGGVQCAAASLGSGFIIEPSSIGFFGTAPGDHSQYD